jgi:hypothetical protein
MKPLRNKTIRCKADCMIIFYDHKDAPIKMVYEENGLENLQLYGNKLNGESYQTRKSILFNQLQNKLYRRLIFGLDSLNNTDLQTMKKSEILKVQEDHERAKKVLNQWKNEITSSYVDKLFSEIFWNSPIAKEMVRFGNDPDAVHEENTLSFKELGIKKRQIAVKLVENGLLPVNFFYLNAA